MFGLRVPIIEATPPEVGTQHYTRTFEVDMWDRCKASVK